MGKEFADDDGAGIDYGEVDRLVFTPARAIHDAAADLRRRVRAGEGNAFDGSTYAGFFRDPCLRLDEGLTRFPPAVEAGVHPAVAGPLADIRAIVDGNPAVSYGDACIYFTVVDLMTPARRGADAATRLGKGLEPNPPGKGADLLPPAVVGWGKAGGGGDDDAGDGRKSFPYLPAGLSRTPVNTGTGSWSAANFLDHARDLRRRLLRWGDEAMGWDHFAPGAEVLTVESRRFRDLVLNRDHGPPPNGGFYVDGNRMVPASTGLDRTSTLWLLREFHERLAALSVGPGCPTAMLLRRSFDRVLDRHVWQHRLSESENGRRVQRQIESHRDHDVPDRAPWRAIWGCPVEAEFLDRLVEDAERLLTTAPSAPSSAVPDPAVPPPDAAVTGGDKPVEPPTAMTPWMSPVKTAKALGLAESTFRTKRREGKVPHVERHPSECLFRFPETFRVKDKD